MVLKDAEETAGPPKCRKGKRGAPQGLMGGVEKEDAGEKGKKEL